MKGSMDRVHRGGPRTWGFVYVHRSGSVGAKGMSSTKAVTTKIIILSILTFRK